MSNFSFLSWVQNPLIGRATSGNSLRPTVRVRLNVQVDGTATEVVDQTIATHGPGDIIGLQPEAVLKTTPPAGEQQYSPLLLPAIEFYEEDLPWRYSPSYAGAPAEQKVPWCFLLTLEEGEFTTLSPNPGPLPAIQVTNLNVFPPLAASGSAADSGLWAWGHVQVNTGIGLDEEAVPSPPEQAVLDAAQAQDFLNNAFVQNPDLAFSRLLSPRKLDPNTTYYAFLVPTYETGRRAGLGIPFGPGSTGDLTAQTVSWHGSGSRAFPVYYQWEFRTGEGGDFESLARLLRPQPLDNFGSQAVAVVTPLGSTAAPTEPVLERVFTLPGIVHPALVPPVVDVPAPVVADLLREVNQGFKRPPATSEAYRKPIVAPPAYGRAYLDAVPTVPPAAPATVPTPGLTAANATSSWFGELNLHPGYRALSAIGGNVIQDNQEEYMQRAWEQVRDLMAANMNLRGMQSGLETTTSLRQQHLPLTTPVLSAGRGTSTSLVSGSDPVTLENYGLHLTGLAFARLLAPGTNLTLQETVKQSRMPLAAFTPAFRRLMKPFGRYQTAQAGRPLRPTQSAPTAATTTLLEKGRSLRQRDSLLTLMAAYNPENPETTGITGGRPREKALRTYQFDDVKMDSVLAKDTPPTAFWFLQGTTYGPTSVSGEAGLSGPGLRFNKAFATFRQIKFTGADVVKPALDLNVLKQAVIEGTKPGPVYLARANRALRLLPHYGDYDAAAGRASRGVAGAKGTSSASVAATSAPLLHQVQPIMAYPVFKEPMSEQLRRRHPELFIPNISEFPSNVVTLLAYNHAFIEAYMVGLNHAFGSELQWRNYPTDLRGSYFRQFWDVSDTLNTSTTAGLSPEELADAEEAHRDITPITSWGTRRLGTNYPQPNRPPLLLAVRGDLLRRFPNTVICAVPGDDSSGSIKPDFSETDKILYPVHRTSLGQDIMLLSFDLPLDVAQDSPGYFFVFHERPGEPQFGLDDSPGVLPGQALPNNWESLAWQHLGYLQSGTTTSVLNLPSTGLTLVNALDEPFPTVDSSAKLAYVLFQQPFMVAIHASQMT